jgi:hypothetical protein
LLATVRVSEGSFAAPFAFAADVESTLGVCAGEIAEEFGEDETDEEVIGALGVVAGCAAT